MMQLVAGDNTLELDDPASGYAIQSVDLGAPNAREVANDRPNVDGNTDITAHVGARAVTINVEVLPDPATRQTLLDQLGRFLHPRTRIDLYFDTEVDGPVRHLRVRPDQFSAPFETPWHVAMSLGFKTVGTPFLSGVDVKQVAFAPDTDVPIGFTFPIVFDLSIAPGMSSDGIVINDGDQPAEWTMRIDGPVTGPRIRNETLGVELAFPSLSIGAGSYVVVSSEDRTVLADGVTSRYSTLDFIHSTWFLLEPGETAITMPTASHDVPAQGQISFYDTYLM